jgi:hypothetical protein
MGAQYFCKHIPLSVPFAVVHGIPSVLMLCGRITNFLSEETQVNEQSSKEYLEDIQLSTPNWLFRVAHSLSRALTL